MEGVCLLLLLTYSIMRIIGIEWCPFQLWTMASDHPPTSTKFNWESMVVKMGNGCGWLLASTEERGEWRGVDYPNPLRMPVLVIQFHREWNGYCYTSSTTTPIIIIAVTVTVSCSNQHYHNNSMPQLWLIQDKPQQQQQYFYCHIYLLLLLFLLPQLLCCCHRLLQPQPIALILSAQPS